MPTPPPGRKTDRGKWISYIVAVIAGIMVTVITIGMGHKAFYGKEPAMKTTFTKVRTWECDRCKQRMTQATKPTSCKFCSEGDRREKVGK